MAYQPQGASLPASPPVSRTYRMSAAEDTQLWHHRPSSNCISSWGSRISSRDLGGSRFFPLPHTLPEPRPPAGPSSLPAVRQFRRSPPGPGARHSTIRFFSRTPLIYFIGGNLRKKGSDLIMSHPFVRATAKKGPFPWEWPFFHVLSQPMGSRRMSRLRALPLKGMRG
jgi:hypothetical protein